MSGKTKEEPRYIVLSVRIHEKELAIIHKMVDEQNISEGAAARILMFGEEGKPKTCVKCGHECQYCYNVSA